jgi:predicted acylesterase/phospholipase RssA
LKDLVNPWIANLARARPASPSYLEVLANSLNIMQDYITRARMAGDPPHVHLRPQLRDFSWLDFHRSKAAIAEGIACVQPAETFILQRCLRADAAPKRS